MKTLAYAGAAINGTDVAISIFQAFGGVGVSLPAEITVTAGEVMIDIALDVYSEYPELAGKEYEVVTILLKDLSTKALDKINQNKYDIALSINPMIPKQVLEIGFETGKKISEYLKN